MGIAEQETIKRRRIRVKKNERKREREIDKVFARHKLDGGGERRGPGSMGEAGRQAEGHLKDRYD